MDPVSLYPLPLIALDYVLGAVMWTLIGRSVLDLFIAPDKDMVIANVFRTITKPFIRFFDRITPRFLVPFMIPLYVAWWFYLVRFYVIPLIFLGRMGMLSFPLESAIGQLFNLN